MSSNYSSKKASPSTYQSRVFTSLSYRDYRLLWSCSFSEHLGEFMEIAAILWLVNEITHSPLMLTLVGSARFLAMVILPLLGGVIADRVDRKKLLIAALLGSALLSAILAILAFSGTLEIWHLGLITFFAGVTTSFNHPARQSIIPNLVRKEHLLNAISLDSISVQASMLISMIIVGYLINSVGIGYIFIIRIAGSLIAILLLATIIIPTTPGAARLRSPWHNLKEGLVYMGKNRLIMVLALLYLIPMMVTMTVSSFIPIFAKDILVAGATGYGYLLAAPGLGSVLALFGLTLFTYFKKRGILIIITGLLMGLSLVGFSLSTWMSLSLIMLTINGGMYIGFYALTTTITQNVVPDEMRGRIMSWREIAFGLGPLGGIIFGAIAQYTGSPVSLSILGGICALVSLALIPYLPKFNKT